MKKTFISVITLIMLVSCALTFDYSYKAEASESDFSNITVDFSELIMLADSGVTAGDHAGHGGHQTRVVHTSHGDYAVFITDSVYKQNSTGYSNSINKFSIIKINGENGPEVIFEDYKGYDTSQVGAFVDNDENVWAVTVWDNKIRDWGDNRMATIFVKAYRVDKNTGTVTCYEVCDSKDTYSGYGYSSFCFDSKANKLYSLTCSGDSGEHPGELVWFIFDMDTLTWEPKMRYVNTPARQSYPYIFGDGKGGMFFVNQRDIRAAASGYPEVSSASDVIPSSRKECEDDEELALYNAFKKGGRQGADYCWDQLELFYIPDVYKEEYTSIMVAEADYSRVLGTDEERLHVAYRMTNQYPGFQNNLGGETFLDQNGYLHVIYDKMYMYAAWNRKNASSLWYHDVFDVSDPNNLKLISSTFLIDDALEDVPYYFQSRMYQDSKGQLYYIATERMKDGSKSELVIYALTGTPTTGYAKTEVARHAINTTGTVNISGTRGNSTSDDTIAVIYMNPTDNYEYIQVKINNN